MQGRDMMEALFVGIDVSKDRLDVHLRPAGEIFTVGRDAAGIEALIARLTAVDVKLIGLEATGGLETVVVAGLAAAGMPVVVVNPAQVRAFANTLGKRAKQTRSTQRSSPASLKRPSPTSGPCPTRKRGCCPT